MSALTYTARFTPQAWVRDYAIDVDPEGETEWDVTAEVVADPKYWAGLGLAGFVSDGTDEVVDNDDSLKADPNAPEWVRAWTGPFIIEVTAHE